MAILSRLTLSILLITCVSAGLFATEAIAASWSARSKEMFSKYCLDCHQGDTAAADLRLDTLSDDLHDRQTFRTWVRVFDKIARHEMPPADADQPTQEQRDNFAHALTEPLTSADLAYQQKFGRAVLRRLNRVEYEYSLRDLLAIPHAHLRELLPADPSAHGFDVVGEALPMSYVQQAAYLQAAETALDETLMLKPQPELREYSMRYLDEGRLAYPKDKPRPEDGLALLSNFSLNPAHYIGYFGAREPGPYHLKIKARTVTYKDGELLDGEKPQILMLYAEVGNDSRHIATFAAPIDHLADLEVTTWLNKGERIRMIAPTMLKSVAPYRANMRDLKYHGPSIAFHTFKAEGPLFDQWPPESHQRLLGNTPLVQPPREERKTSPPLVPDTSQPQDVEPLIKRFLARVFRGPVPEPELHRYVNLAQQRLADGARFDEALLTGYKAALCSPDFLYFQETPGRLDDFALAIRLSYFLWRSVPDETLLALARSGKLHEPQELKSQVERLLDDPRSERFVTDFTDQWLGLRAINFTQPDEDLYPEYTDLHLQDSLVRETRAFFAELVRANLPVRNVVDSDFAFVNAQLAELYGLDNVHGVEIRKVTLPPDHVRGGLLTQASVLKVTANGTTTSPVVRGAWFMDRIVGDPAPPPPASVPAIEPDINGATTVRELLAKHRAAPECASCHAKIDPPGFALECFDVMGGFRAQYRSLGEGTPVDKKIRGWKVKYRLGPTVDSSGQTPDGEKFEDLRAFQQLLMQDEAQLARNLVEKLVTYSTGAPVSFADRQDVDKIVSQLETEQYGIRSIIQAVVASRMFQQK